VRVLVTGGAGYIGSQTVRRLAAAGHDCVVLDTLERGDRRAVPDVEVVVGSVADQPLVRRLLEERSIGAVLHFAALKAADESVREPGRYFGANVGGSLALLSAMEAVGVPYLVFSSSCAVYGEPERLPIDETARLQPESPYGESKLLVERALPWFAASGISYVSLRYFNAAGAELDGSHGEDWRHAPNLVPVAIKAALRGTPLHVFGTDYPTVDGTAVRDYVHVLDLADAHIAALDRLATGEASTTLNLGTGRGATVREVIGTVERASGRSIEVIESPRRSGDPAAVWADPRRAEAELGWAAHHDLEAIVGSAVRWHRSHPDAYDGEIADAAVAGDAAATATPAPVDA
jgi:UDP-glucose 4-epimerase